MQEKSWPPAESSSCIRARCRVELKAALLKPRWSTCRGLAAVSTPDNCTHQAMGYSTSWPQQCPYISTGSHSHTTEPAGAAGSKRQQTAKALWTSSLYQHTAAKPQVASSVLLMPLHHVLQLFHMGWDLPPLDPCSQKPLGLRCLPAVSRGLQCSCWQQPQLCLCQAHPTAQQFPTAQPVPAAPALQM